MLEPSGSESRLHPNMDVGEGDVIVGADGLDGAQVSDAVLVLQQVTVVHRHPKLTAGAQDPDLQHNQTSASALRRTSPMEMRENV